MTKKEQVMAVLRGEIPAEIPSGFWLHFPAGNEFGEAAKNIHLEFFRNSRTALCKVMNENLVPLQKEITCAGELDRMVPIPADAEIITREVSLVKDICDEMKGEAVVLVTVHSVVASAFHALVGADKNFEENRHILAEYLRANPSGMKRLFRILTDFLVALTKECLENGADGIYLAALGGERDVFTDEEFAEFIKPCELEILAAAKGAACNVLHMCKDNLELNRYKDYPADVYNWGVFSDNPSLCEGREIFGADKVYLGGLDDRDGVLVDGTDEEIRSAVRQVIDSFGKTRWILGADCTLPTEVELHRIHVAIEEASRYKN